MDPDFLLKIDQLRELWGEPLVISSGARCLWWNEMVGGVPSSKHLLGHASDILVSKKDRTRFIDLAEKVGFTGLGVYDHFIHLDIGPARKWGTHV
jgi:uncharacterized protein YcbK (DUF882 family)